MAIDKREFNYTKHLSRRDTALSRVKQIGSDNINVLKLFELVDKVIINL